MREMVEKKKTTTTPESAFNFEETEDMSEEERWKEEELWETLSVAENREELEIEITTLKELIKQAIVVINKEVEVKLIQLKDTMTDLGRRFPNRKILIFTESKDTLNYLEKKNWEYQGGKQKPLNNLE